MSLKTIAVSLGAVYASRGIFLDVIQAIMKTSMSFFDRSFAFVLRKFSPPFHLRVCRIALKVIEISHIIIFNYEQL